MALLPKWILISLVLTGGLAGHAVTLSPEVIAALRAHAEAMRSAAIPAPPLNVRELQWSQLSPAGWKPQEILDRLGVDKLEDKDARAPAILAEVQHEWQQAPPIGTAPEGTVRLTGFAVMLDDGKNAVS